MISEKTKQSVYEKIVFGIPVRRGIRSTNYIREYASDPGDFGRGIYYDTNYYRAKTYGSVVKSILKLSNPIVLSAKEAYEIAEKFQTVKISSPTDFLDRVQTRLINAQKMTLFMINQGYDGLASVNTRMGSIEIVDYRPYM